MNLKDRNFVFLLMLYIVLWHIPFLSETIFVLFRIDRFHSVFPISLSSSFYHVKTFDSILSIVGKDFYPFFAENRKVQYDDDNQKYRRQRTKLQQNIEHILKTVCKKRGFSFRLLFHVLYC